MSARPQFTITLGRGSGQVIKRSRSVSSNDNITVSRGKQQSRERSGKSMVDLDMDGNICVNKRQRREIDTFGDKLLDDMQRKSKRHIGCGDLRLKLLKKSSSQGRDTCDLRQKLSHKRKVPPRYPSQHHVREHSNPNSMQHSPPRINKDSRIPLTRSGDRRIPSTRSADDLRKFNYERRSYSLWTLEGRRNRSPDRRHGASKAISPPIRYKELQASSIRSNDASRSLGYMMNGLNDASRSAPYTRKLVAPGDAAPPDRIVAERSFRVSDEPFTVEKLLHSLDLDKYHQAFRKEEVDITVLSQMGENDLKEMGIPMGPRKKILLAAWSHTNQNRL